MAAVVHVKSKRERRKEWRDFCENLKESGMDREWSAQMTAHMTEHLYFALSEDIPSQPTGAFFVHIELGPKQPKKIVPRVRKNKRLAR